MREIAKAASDAIGDFLTFADGAINQYVTERCSLASCEPIDPDDWAKGWKYI